MLFHFKAVYLQCNNVTPHVVSHILMDLLERRVVFYFYESFGAQLGISQSLIKTFNSISCHFREVKKHLASFQIRMGLFNETF